MSGRDNSDRERHPQAYTSRSLHQDRSIDRYDRPRSPTSRSGRPLQSDGRSRQKVWPSPDRGDPNGRGQRGLKRFHDGDEYIRDGRRFKVHYEAGDVREESSSGDHNDRHDARQRSNDHSRPVRQHPTREVAEARPRSTTPTPVTDKAFSTVEPDERAKADVSALPSEIQDAPFAEPIDEDAIIEARRKRREALRAKHKVTEPPLLQKAIRGATTLPNLDGESPGQRLIPAATIGDIAPHPENPASTPASPAPSMTEIPNTPASPAVISFKDDADLANPAAKRGANPEPEPGEVISADNGRADIKRKKIRDEFDMFASDDDDDGEDPSRDEDVIAADTEAKARKEEAEDGTRATRLVEARQLDKSMLDDWDDPQGYYRVIVGELLDNRYAVQEILGKGVSSRVVRAVDTTDNHLVAIKIIIKHEQMRRYGLTEMAWMRTLAEADPDDRRHILRLERHFDHKGHLCVVFESMSIDLRKVLEKFGRDIGINIRAVRVYAHQMFLALGLMAKCDLIHADLKPDNMLVNDDRNRLKIADFGSAVAVRDVQVNRELVSRYYRAPEIMIGMKGDPALDMWSVGCTLFELYTGKFCFTGADANQMLKQIMEAKGKIPNRMLKKAEFWHEHFDADGTFISSETDSITHRQVVRKLNMSRTVANREIRARILASSTDPNPEEIRELNLFADLVDKCLILDPSRRIRPHEALRHPFISRPS